MVVIQGFGLFGLAQIVPAFQAEVAVGRLGCATCGTFHFQLAAAFIAELGAIRELSVTLWTLDSSPSGRRVRLLSRGAL